MHYTIYKLKQELNTIECELECTYKKICKLHARKQYELAAPLFKVSAQLNQLALQTKERIRFYEAAARLTKVGVKVELTKKPILI